MNITITISDTDQKILENDLLDIEDWVNDAVSGKINSSWKRMQSQWTTLLMNDPSYTDPIPSNKEDFINTITGLPTYKNRAQLEEDSRLAVEGE
jgi:hypothetical protein